MTNSRRRKIQQDIYNIAIIFVLLTAVLMAACSNTANDVEPGKLVVPGTGGSEALLKVLAASFSDTHPEQEVIIPKSTGTVGGINAARTGETPLARVGRPLKREELNWGLAYLPLAKDAVVFAVGNQVNIESLEVEQLGSIFQGKIVDWEEVGDKKAPIRVVIRPPSETALKIIKKNLPPFREIVFTDQAKVVYHDYEMMDMLAKFPTSIGFLTNASIKKSNNKIRALKIGGLAPTSANLTSGQYPLFTEYGLIYKGKDLDPSAVAFVDFVYSDAGKKIMEDFGMVPATRK